ncbi:MAG: cyclic lactone autoinducer peptide [Clostridia bacterium]|nr:cyclic lactone autoinducer peptide [Clostridia bacterium]
MVKSVKNFSNVSLCFMLSAVVTIATFIAQTSSSICALWWYGQPDIPACLVKKD